MMLNGPRGILNLARARDRKDGARGQIMVLFTLVIVLLMVLAAVVIDAGLLRTDSARLQNALDAGALAAAQSLPANNANVATVEGTAINYAGANFPGLGLGTNDIKFACIIGIDATTGGPHLIDMPAVCNVPAASASDWVCTAAVCWAPCDPVAHPADVCNTVILKKDVTRDYTFARAVGINSGNTGTLQSAACTGPCGPTMPVDVVLIIDRTGSMAGLENTLYNGANAVLQAYDPTIQHVALGMLGPSSQDTPCTTGAYGRILNNSAPAIAGSTTADVQSAGNMAGGATTLVINNPTKTAAGDFLVAGITVNGGTGVTITPPSGWTLIRRTDNGTNVGMASYYKFATASEPGSYSWGLGATAVRASGGILRYTGVDTGTPINVSGGATGNDITSPYQVTAPAVSAGATTAIIGFYGIATGTTYSANSKLTEAFDVQNPDPVGPSTQGATGTSTTSDYATAGAGGQWVAQHIALDPVPIANYPATTPPYSDAVLKADMSKWIPVGLTGTLNADVTESYRNANGTVNASSKIAKTIGCVLPPNGLTQGTDQASPFDFARAYLVGTSLTPAHARPTVTTGIIFETDGTPQTTNFTCQQAQTAATAAKNAGIEVFTIGYFASNGPNQPCPDGSGPWHGKTVIQSLAAMATNSSTINTTRCDTIANSGVDENADGDHFYCTPDSTQISNVFRSAALALASGSRLVQMYPQPIVSSVGGGGGSAGGATITIGGKFFTEAYSVMIGGLPAASFTVVSDTQIQAVTPAGPANTAVTVQVSTPGGSSSIVGAPKYTYGP
jgi:hypothetical protein